LSVTAITSGPAPRAKSISVMPGAVEIILCTGDDRYSSFPVESFTGLLLFSGCDKSEVVQKSSRSAAVKELNNTALQVLPEHRFSISHTPGKQNIPSILEKVRISVPSTFSPKADWESCSGRFPDCGSSLVCAFPRILERVSHISRHQSGRMQTHSPLTVAGTVWDFHPLPF